MKDEIKILATQAKKKEQLLAGLPAANDPTNKAAEHDEDDVDEEVEDGKWKIRREGIEKDLYRLYDDIKSLEKQLKGCKYEFTELNSKVLNEIELQLNRLEGAVKQSNHLVNITEDACNVVKHAIMKLENTIGQWKNVLLDIDIEEEEEAQKMRLFSSMKQQRDLPSTKALSSSKTVIHDEDVGWRNDDEEEEDEVFSQQPNHLSALEGKEGDEEDESERMVELFYKQLDKAETSVIELQRHSRNVFLREIAKKKWLEVVRGGTYIYMRICLSLEYQDFQYCCALHDRIITLLYYYIG
jgi:hypothetical protein